MRQSSTTFALLLLLLPLAGLHGAMARASPQGDAEPSSDPFYERLMRDGQRAESQGDLGNAERYYRLANFGLLEDPPALLEGLVRLAGVQLARGDVDGFRETFDRVVDLEDRLRTYTLHPPPPALRQTFEAAVLQHVPRAVLEMSSAFKELAGSASAAGDGGGGERTGGAPAPPPLQETASAPPEPRATEPLPPQAAGQLSEARQLLRRAQTVAELERPLEIARSVADSYPSSAAAQHLTAEIAYRASRWQEAATYFRRGGDPGEDKPTLLFFMAISFYEAGDREGAARALERSLPRLERTPFVQKYVDLILE